MLRVNPTLQNNFRLKFKSKFCPKKQTWKCVESWQTLRESLTQSFNPNDHMLPNLIKLVWELRTRSLDCPCMTWSQVSGSLPQSLVARETTGKDFLMLRHFSLLIDILMNILMDILMNILWQCWDIYIHILPNNNDLQKRRRLKTLKLPVNEQRVALDLDVVLQSRLVPQQVLQGIGDQLKIMIIRVAI